MTFQEKKAKEYSDLVDGLTEIAYSRDSMLVNSVLGKVTLGNEYYSAFLANKALNKLTFLKKLWLICLYFIRNGMTVVSCCLLTLLYKLKVMRAEKEGAKLFVDLSLIETKVAMSGKVEDRYFAKAIAAISDEGLDYCYVPLMYAYNNPFKIYACIKVLQNFGTPHVTEFQFFSIKDLIRLIYFYVTYPFTLLSFIKKNVVGNLYIREALYSSIGDQVAKHYIRLLLGEKLGGINPVGGAAYLSYCEYRPSDKCLYKGIRNSGGNLKVYAYQGFLRCKLWLNPYIPDFHERYGLTPHKIIPNGRANVPEKTSLDYGKPLSIRYGHLFTDGAPSCVYQSNRVLVLLSFALEDSLDLIKLLLNTPFKNANVRVKIHPTNDLSKISPLIPSNWELVEGELSKFLRESSYVIVTASGTAVEAVIRQCSVLSYAKENEPELNPLLDLGEGDIWKRFYDETGLISAYESLKKVRGNSSEKIAEIAQKYKSIMFSEPTREKILDSFEYKKY